MKAVIFVNPDAFVCSREFRQEFYNRVRQFKHLPMYEGVILAMPKFFGTGLLREEIICNGVDDVWYYSNTPLVNALCSTKIRKDYPYQLFPDEYNYKKFLDTKCGILELEGDGYYMWVKQISKEWKSFEKESVSVLITCSPILLFFDRDYKERFLYRCMMLKSEYSECDFSVTIPKRLEKSAKEIFAGCDAISSLVTYPDYGAAEVCLITGDSSKISSNRADILFHYDGQAINSKCLTQEGRKLMLHHKIRADIKNVILPKSNINN